MPGDDSRPPLAKSSARESVLRCRLAFSNPLDSGIPNDYAVSRDLSDKLGAVRPHVRLGPWRAQDERARLEIVGFQAVTMMRSVNRSSESRTAVPTRCRLSECCRSRSS